MSLAPQEARALRSAHDTPCAEWALSRRCGAAAVRFLVDEGYLAARMAMLSPTRKGLDALIEAGGLTREAEVEKAAGKRREAA